jgi:hypothetical protein
LIKCLEFQVDNRAIRNLVQTLRDKFPADRDLTLEEWTQESKRMLKPYPEELNELILEVVGREEAGTQWVSRDKLEQLLEQYEHLPVRIKRDKNKSENLYYVMNSNKRGQPLSKDQLLAQLKQENERLHLSKLLLLISIKIEEKYSSVAKAFLAFDRNESKTIEWREFLKGVEGLRVKLPKEELRKVFDHLDANHDQQLTYNEFCGLSEEKRRNIDPFEAQKAENPNPYTNLPSNLTQTEKSHRTISGFSASHFHTFDELESQAASMRLINHHSATKLNQKLLPQNIRSNKDFTFGVRSDHDFDKEKHLSPGQFFCKKGFSSVNQVLKHNDNLKESLLMRINMRLLDKQLKKKASHSKQVHTTKASEIRAQSVLANKALHDLETDLDKLQGEAMLRHNNASMLEINKERHKLARVNHLPPIERIRTVNQSLSTHSLAKLFKPSLDKRIPQLNEAN